MAERCEEALHWSSPHWRSQDFIVGGGGGGGGGGHLREGSTSVDISGGGQALTSLCKVKPKS